MSGSDDSTIRYDIKWPMLDKTRFIPLSLLSTFTVRSLLYPFALVRTRLQVQVQSSIYKGTWHALTTTVRYEGFRSLYKGFLVYNGQLIPGLMYVTTFESTRSHAKIITNNEYLCAGLAGAISSSIAQILACPIDIISQHMQLVGLKTPREKVYTKPVLSERGLSKVELKHRPIHRIYIPSEIRNSNYLIFKQICKTILYENASKTNNKARPSLKGFYRGYFVSTFLFSATSAVWWPSYYFYQTQILKIETLFPNTFSLPLLVVQCIAGPLSSLTSTILTNPLDVCRTRIQIQPERRKLIQIMTELWHEERYNVFTKGLTARLSHSCVYSIFIIFGYETVKRISLKEEYKEQMRW